MTGASRAAVQPAGAVVAREIAAGPLGGRLRRWLPGVLLGAGLLVATLRGGSYELVARGELFVLVWWLLLVGLAAGLLPAARPPAGVRVALIALAGLLAWTALGLLWTTSAERTVAEAVRVLGLLGVLLLVAVGFGRDRAAPAIAALTVVAAVVCALAMTSRLAPSLVSSTLARTGTEILRLSYPFNYWNALGSWASMTVALTFAGSVHARPWWLRGPALFAACLAVGVAYLTYSRASAFTIPVAVLAVIALAAHRWHALACAAVVAAGSAAVVGSIRGTHAIAQGTGTAGAGTVVLVLAFVAVGCLAAAGLLGLARLERVRVPHRIARTTGALVLAAIALAGAAEGPALASQAWESFNRPVRESTTDPARRFTSLGGGRRFVWNVALEQFRAQPLHGIGPGTFEFAWNRNPARTERVRDAHSIYLESLAELGVPGLVLVVLALGALLTGAVRGALARSGAPAAGVAGSAALLVFCLTAGVDWQWEMTALPATALSCGALAAAGAARPTARAPALRRVATSLAALAAIALQAPAFAASIQVRASQNAARSRPLAAVDDASRAIRAAPWAASPYLQRALVLERAGLLRQAAADAQRAVARETPSWELWLVLARIEAERGRVRAALTAAARARALNPASPVFRVRERQRG